MDRAKNMEESIDIGFSIDFAIQDNKNCYKSHGQVVKEPFQDVVEEELQPLAEIVISTNFEDLRDKLNNVISDYLLDLSQQPIIEKFSFDSLGIVNSESLDEKQQENMKDIEQRQHRQKIYQNIVDKMSLTVIESIRSMGDSVQTDSWPQRQHSQSASGRINMFRSNMSEVEQLKQIIRDREAEIVALRQRVLFLESKLPTEQFDGQIPNIVSSKGVIDSVLNHFQLEQSKELKSSSKGTR